MFVASTYATPNHHAAPDAFSRRVRGGNIYGEEAA